MKLPADEWLCRKMETLNITVTEGYPYRASETTGLSRDQFIRVPKTLKWYDMYSEKHDFSWSKVHNWSNEPAKLNSSFKVARYSLASAPTFRPLYQGTLRKWERFAWDQAFMCNKAAGLLQRNWNYLITINGSITQAMARTRRICPRVCSQIWPT